MKAALRSTGRELRGQRGMTCHSRWHEKIKASLKRLEIFKRVYWLYCSPKAGQVVKMVIDKKP